METAERIAKLKELLDQGEYYAEDLVEQLNESIDENEFQVKYSGSEDCSTHRWYEVVLEVIEINEGVFVGYQWERGHTENQENMFEDQTLYEVFPEKVVRIDYKIGKEI